MWQERVARTISSQRLTLITRDQCLNRVLFICQSWLTLKLSGTVPLSINLTGNTFANTIRTKTEWVMKQQQNRYGTGAGWIWNKHVLYNVFSRTRSHLQERVLRTFRLSEIYMYCHKACHQVPQLILEYPFQSKLYF